MPFDRPTINQIKNRIEKSIESRLFGKTALLRRAILRVLARVFAGAIHTSYGYIQNVIKQLFVTTATGKWLERHGKMWNVLKQPGAYAVGEGLFHVNTSDPFIIPKDTIIQSEDGIEYAVIEDTMIGMGAGDVPIQAVESGISGNLEIIVPINFQFVSSTVDGIRDDIAIFDDLLGGQDVEKDEHYRNRILLHIQEPPMGGNASDYIKWALDVTGVDQAWSYPLAQGPGTVATCITQAGTDSVPTAILLSDVAAHINEVKPVGATSYVESIEDSAGANGVALVEYIIEIYPNTVDLQNAITKNITDLFYPLKPGTDILISQVRGAVSAVGVEDYGITDFFVDAISKPINDYSLPGYAYPQLDNIIFLEKS